MAESQHIDTDNRAEAVRLAPWAAYVVASSVGFMAFASLAGFQSWMRRRNFITA